VDHITGLPYQFEISPSSACIYMQSVTGTQEVFFVNFLSSDSPPQMQMKKAALALALRAFASGFQVTLSHEDTSAALQEAQIVNRDISPVGEAILGDLYLDFHFDDLLDNLLASPDAFIHASSNVMKTLRRSTPNG